MGLVMFFGGLYLVVFIRWCGLELFGMFLVGQIFGSVGFLEFIYKDFDLEELGYNLVFDLNEYISVIIQVIFGLNFNKY